MHFLVERANAASDGDLVVCVCFFLHDNSVCCSKCHLPGILGYVCDLTEGRFYKVFKEDMPVSFAHCRAQAEN